MVVPVYFSPLQRKHDFLYTFIEVCGHWRLLVTYKMIFQLYQFVCLNGNWKEGEGKERNGKEREQFPLLLCERKYGRKSKQLKIVSRIHQFLFVPRQGGKWVEKWGYFYIPIIMAKAMVHQASWVHHAPINSNHSIFDQWLILFYCRKIPSPKPPLPPLLPHCSPPTGPHPMIHVVEYFIFDISD